MAIDQQQIYSGTRAVRGSILRADTAQVTGTSLTGTEAGLPATFIITVTDRFGNIPCDAGPSCVPPPTPRIALELREDSDLVSLGQGQYVLGSGVYLCRYDTACAPDADDVNVFSDSHARICPCAGTTRRLQVYMLCGSPSSGTASVPGSIIHTYHRGLQTAALPQWSPNTDIQPGSLGLCRYFAGIGFQTR